MFPDGMLPEEKIIDQWLDLVDKFFENTKGQEEQEITLEKHQTQGT